MKKTFWIGLVAVIVSAAPRAFGDSIKGSASAAWQTWSAADLNENGKPYWDNHSYDGPLMNVGFCLTDTGNCHQLGKKAPGALPFWGEPYNQKTDTGGKADGSIYFTRVGSSGKNVEVELAIAGDAKFNEFGWYNASLTHPSCNVIFDGKGPGATAAFFPSASYGFCLVGEDQSDVYGTWFTQTAEIAKERATNTSRCSTAAVALTGLELRTFPSAFRTKTTTTWWSRSQRPQRLLLLPNPPHLCSLVPDSWRLDACFVGG